jgi:hypothetical protein
MAPRIAAVAPIPLPPLICACGSAKWVACAPGTDAERPSRANLRILHPAPAVPMVVACAACWPWWRPAANPHPGRAARIKVKKA